MYPVWMEGYAATGQSSRAQFQGFYPGANFADACKTWARTSDSPEYFNPERLTYWGCQLFDNEADARRSFG